MKRINSILAATTLIALGIGVADSGSAYGQESTPAAADSKALPTAKEVIDNYIKATGGEAAWRTKNFMTIKGKTIKA